jgi:hypothetical protein
MDLAQVIFTATRRPTPTGLGTQVFTATVVAPGPPVRIQDAAGVQLEAIATFGYTPAAGHQVLALQTAAGSGTSTVYLVRIA